MLDTCRTNAFLKDPRKELPTAEDHKAHNQQPSRRHKEADSKAKKRPKTLHKGRPKENRKLKKEEAVERPY